MRPRQRVPLRVPQGRDSRDRPPRPGPEVEEEPDGAGQLLRHNAPQPPLVRNGRVLRDLRRGDDVPPVQGRRSGQHRPGLPGRSRGSGRLPGLQPFRPGQHEPHGDGRRGGQRRPGGGHGPEVLRQGDPSHQPVPAVQQRPADPGAQRQTPWASGARTAADGGSGTTSPGRRGSAPPTASWNWWARSRSPGPSGRCTGSPTCPPGPA